MFWLGGGIWTGTKLSFKIHSLLEEKVCCLFISDVFIWFDFSKVNAQNNGAFSTLFLIFKYIAGIYMGDAYFSALPLLSVRMAAIGENYSSQETIQLKNATQFLLLLPVPPRVADCCKLSVGGWLLLFVLTESVFLPVLLMGGWGDLLMRRFQSFL